MTQKQSISSSELGTLWMTYQQQTMIQRMLEYFIEQADDNRAKEIMQNTHKKIINYVEDIKTSSKMKVLSFLSDSQRKMLILVCLSCMTTCSILCFFVFQRNRHGITYTPHKYGISQRYHSSL